MRDPNRIDGFLNRIKKIWKENPDLRFGQLINNVITDPAAYYIEDDDMIKLLEGFYGGKNEKD